MHRAGRPSSAAGGDVPEGYTPPYFVWIRVGAHWHHQLISATITYLEIVLIGWTASKARTLIYRARKQGFLGPAVGRTAGEKGVL